MTPESSFISGSYPNGPLAVTSVGVGADFEEVVIGQLEKKQGDSGVTVELFQKQREVIKEAIIMKVWQLIDELPEETVLAWEAQGGERTSVLLANIIEGLAQRLDLNDVTSEILQMRRNYAQVLNCAYDDLEKCARDIVEKLRLIPALDKALQGMQAPKKVTV
jgi:hypothetical protein